MNSFERRLAAVEEVPTPTAACGRILVPAADPDEAEQEAWCARKIAGEPDGGRGLKHLRISFFEAKSRELGTMSGVARCRVIQRLGEIPDRRERAKTAVQIGCVPHPTRLKVCYMNRSFQFVSILI